VDGLSTEKQPGTQKGKKEFNMHRVTHPTLTLLPLPDTNINQTKSSYGMCVAPSHLLSTLAERNGGKTLQKEGWNMMNEAKSESVDELVKEAEMALRKSMARLGQWGETARELIEDKPSAILAVAAVSGFVSGALVRNTLTMRRAAANRAAGAPGASSADNSTHTSGQRTGTPGILQQIAGEKSGMDPLVLVAGGLVAGLLIGPRLIEQAFAGLTKLNSSERTSRSAAHEFDSNPLRATGSMNERPFEKV